MKKTALILLGSSSLMVALTVLPGAAQAACPGGDKKPSVLCPGDKKPSACPGGDKKPSACPGGDKKPSQG